MYLYSLRGLLGGSWVVLSSFASMTTVVMTPIRGTYNPTLELAMNLQNSGEQRTAFDLYRMLQSSRGTQLPCFSALPFFGVFLVQELLYKRGSTRFR